LREKVSAKLTDEGLMRRLGGIFLIVLGGLGMIHLLFWIVFLCLIDVSMFGQVGCGVNRFVWSSHLGLAMLGAGFIAAGARVLKDAPMDVRPLVVAEVLLLLAIGWVVFVAPACPFPSR
jgi:hypothetical protein